jgi:hypothetical protein
MFLQNEEQLKFGLEYFYPPPKSNKQSKNKNIHKIILPVHFPGWKLGLLRTDRPEVEVVLRAGC